MLIQTGADIELDLEAFYQIILSGIDRMQSDSAFFAGSSDGGVVGANDR